MKFTNQVKLLWNSKWIYEENHKSSQVVVEIPSGRMIIFTEDTYHAGVSTFEWRNVSYPSNLRIFSYIVEETILSDNENIKSIKGNTLCTNCQTCLNMPKGNMYYPGHAIKFGMSPYHQLESNPKRLSFE